MGFLVIKTPHSLRKLSHLFAKLVCKLGDVCLSSTLSQLAVFQSVPRIGHLECL